MNQVSSQSDNKWLTHSHALIFKMAAAAINENGDTLPLLRRPESASFTPYVYQNSSKSVDNKPMSSISLIS
jgi:hypothetical protein